MRFAAVRAGGGISIAHQLLEFGSAIVTDIFVNGHLVGSRRRVFIILAQAGEGVELGEFLEQFPTVTRETAIQALEEAKDSLLARIV